MNHREMAAGLILKSQKKIKPLDVAELAVLCVSVPPW
jgi:hypothetical protein